MRRVLRWVGTGLLWTVIALCLTITVVPFFLDRIYYRGPVSAHFDGKRFFNPDGDDTFAPSPKTSRAKVIWSEIFGDSTRPVWPAHVAVNPVKPAPNVWDDAMIATWVGHATMLVQTDGINILTDPVWSETVGPWGIGPRRVAEPGIRLEDLPKIDLILISHDHYDHMDLMTLKKLWDRDHPLIITSLGNDAILRSAGIESRALDWGGHVFLAHGRAYDSTPNFECGARETGCGFPEIIVTRNHHWGARWLTDRSRALWSSFVVKLPHGNFFFSGDTGLGDGTWPAEAAAYGPIRLAAIPIGAFRFEEKQMANGSHIGPDGAIRVWNGLGRPHAIPIHWGTFRLSREGYDTPPKMLDTMLRCAGEDPSRFAAVGIGVPVSIPALDAGPAVPDLAALDACEKRGDFDRFR